MKGFGSTVLVTGASGFVGDAVARRLARDGFRVRGASRRAFARTPHFAELVAGVDLGTDYDWAPAVAGCQSIVHTAARVHVMNESASDPLAEFRRVNVAGTLALAQSAARAGVRRFVFVSSIKVNGEGTSVGHPYRSHDTPAPEDPYGVSKLEAEAALLQLGSTSKMEIVCIRPVLVYGPGVKANFLAMIRAVARGIPLPFGAVDNKRSLVGLDNLVDLIVLCLDHPAAANRTFLVSDDQDLSTTELLQRVGVALGRPARLVPIPTSILEMGATILGKRKLARRLLGSLQVDISDTRRALDWSPPVSVDRQLQATAEWFRLQRGER